MSVDGPGGASDAPSEDDDGRGSGLALCPVVLIARGIAFDGVRVWTANGDGSISIFNNAALGATATVQTLHTGFKEPFGLVFDGANMWVTDLLANALYKLDISGEIVQTVATGTAPAFPVFDGTNIWVPNSGSSSITVVQATTGTVTATIASDAMNNLSEPAAAAFDGERILVTNQSVSSPSVTLFKAADLSLIEYTQFFSAPNRPYGACSDGMNFWVTNNATQYLDRM